MRRDAAIPPGVLLQPLLWDGDIEDDESFLGYLTRRAAEHHLGVNAVVLGSVGLKLQHQGKALFDCTQEQAERLAVLLRADPHRLTDVICPVIGSDHTGDLVRWGGRTMRRRDIETRYRRLAPLAITERQRHRQPWLLRLLSHCPVSFERLIQQCPSCGRVLLWSRSKPIDRCDHEDCIHWSESIETRGDLLPESMRREYARFAALLSSSSAVREKAERGLHPEIAQLANPDLVDLVSVLGLFSDSQENEIGSEEDTTSRDAAVITRGIRAVEAWPQALVDLTAQAITERLRRPELWSQMKWHTRGYRNPVIRDLLICTVPELRQSLKRVTIPNSPQVMLQTELVKRTGLRADQAGEVCRALAKKTDFILAKETMIDHALACDFISQLTTSVPIGTTANALHLPNYAIAQLIAGGFLEAPENPGIAALYPNGRVTKNSQLSLFARLVRLPVLAEGSRSTLPLSIASKIIGGGPKPWATILSAILSRVIPCWRSEPRARPTVRNLCIQKVDLDNLRMLRPSAGEKHALPDMVSKTDAYELLNITTNKGKWFEQSGELEFRPSGRKHACPMTAVLAIAAARIYGPELSLRLSCSPNILEPKLQAAGIDKLACGGWDRNSALRAFGLDGV